MQGYRFDLAAQSISRIEIEEDGSAVLASLEADRLFVVVGTTVRPLGTASALDGVWRSRTFSMPFEMGFGWLQVNGQLADGVIVRVYVDEVLVYTTPTLLVREPVRLPAIKGYHWAFEIEGTDRITSLSVAQAAQELIG